MVYTQTTAQASAAPPAVCKPAYADPAFALRLLMRSWSSRRCLPSLIAILCLLPVACDGDGPEWKRVAVPETWKSPPAVQDGWCWERTFFKTPSDWSQKEVVIALECADDAREVYLNGKLLGPMGAMPPAFRSALGEIFHFKIPKEFLRKDDWNVLALRIYYRDGRVNFNVAAPILVAGDQGLRLAGAWEHAAGETKAAFEFDAAKIGGDFERKVADSATLEKEFRKLGDNDAGPLSPQETLAKLTFPADVKANIAVADPDIAQPLSIRFDPQGRMWLVEYRQYPHPAGLNALSRDKFLRTVYDKIPPAPPNHDRGADRISIHEDVDGDGVYEKHSVFLDGLNLCTSIALDTDGVWVLHPPYLLFYPDRNHDDVPDGDPELHLQGFGIEDSHSVVSNLKWGPDGWLYASQGSTVSGAVQKPGDKEITRSLGQLIWRYHPRLRKYEVFAEGGGNTFGVEIDGQGRVYSGHNGGNTRGFHYVQGGYYQKGFGKHGSLSNPFTFGYFEAMKHAEVQRFTHALLRYEASVLPEKYRDHLFGVGPLQGHVTYSEITPIGSSFQTRDLGYLMTSTDSWVRPVDVQQGPDGCIYIADMYEQRIDHGSHYQGRVHKESGRVYRVAPADKQVRTPNLTKLDDAALLAELKGDNRARREQARWLLTRRKPALSEADSLAALMKADGTEANERLWLHMAWFGLNERAAAKLLEHPSASVRSWVARVSCDDGELSPTLTDRIAAVATKEANIEARVQYAASARRLPVESTLKILRGLLAHQEDASDVFQPLMLWWAMEAHVKKSPAELIAIFKEPDVWNGPLVREAIAPRLVKRFVTAGDRESLRNCGKLIAAAPVEHRKGLVSALETQLDSMPPTALPDELTQLMAEFGGGSLTLRVRRGDAAATQEALARLADDKADATERGRLTTLLVQANAEATRPVLLKLLTSTRDEGLRASILAALQRYNDDEIGKSIIASFAQWPEETRLAAMMTLASRKSWSRQFVDAITSRKWEAERTPTSVVDAIAVHSDPALAADVAKLWPKATPPNAEELTREISRYTNIIRETTGNPYAGRKLFADSCAKCHRLFDTGGKIGPDLTQYKRDDLPILLQNVLSPSATIREGFENYVAATEDGRTLTGFIADQDAQAVTLQAADGQPIILQRSEIEELRLSKVSLMPEGLLSKLTEQQIRDLFAYLRMSQPLPD